MVGPAGARPYLSRNMLQASKPVRGDASTRAAGRHAPPFRDEMTPANRDIGQDPASPPSSSSSTEGSLRAEDRIRAIFENCVQLAGLLSPDGVLLEANPAALDFVEAERDDVVGRPVQETPWWSIVEDPENLRRAIERAAAGEKVDYDLRATDSDGKPAVFAFSLVPVSDPRGEVEAIVAEARDITQLYGTREALRSSRTKLSAILSGTLDAIVSVDEDQRIRLFNQGAERIFGYEAEEALGEPLDILIPEHFRRAHRSDLVKFGEGPDVARRMGERGEIVGRRKGGELFPAEASISKVEVGGRRAFTVVLRDITERKQAERERAALAEAEREARLDAEAATRARDEMLRVVSHDLRNPVTGVLMGVRMLRFQLESEHPGREILEGIELAAERQMRLIRDLSDVASIEAGRLSVKRQRHQVAALVRTAARPFESLAREREVELAWDETEALPPVLVDHDRIVQALSNLLDNALKVTPSGGSVRIEPTETGEWVRIVVRDTGPGIPDEEQEMVFERFWRGSSSGHAGTGLGLAIARGIVESHGGEISVRSRPGAGSEFQFTVPIARE
ncbi:MAG: PAS domain-containing sensor histidine kinase [Gemmatimonadota bacterium]